MPRLPVEFDQILLCGGFIAQEATDKSRMTKIGATLIFLNYPNVYISAFQKYLHVSNKTLVVERIYKITNSVSNISLCLSDHRSAVF